MALSFVGIMTPDEETIPLFIGLVRKLSEYNLAYLHIVGPAADLTGTPVETLQDNYFNHFRQNYRGRLMANLGFTQESGNTLLEAGLADLVSFGSPYIANPDLVERFEHHLPLAESERSTWYSSPNDEEGYTDYLRADDSSLDNQPVRAGNSPKDSGSEKASCLNRCKGNAEAALFSQKVFELVTERSGSLQDRCALLR